MDQTLLDLGEREILRLIIPRFVDGAGDDCALINIPGGTIVATTDPVPPPAAQVIGGDTDPYWAGWLLVTINASDVAAAGGLPLAFLAALDCEASASVSEFERLLEGVRAACDATGFRYVGGNLREGKKFAGVGTALGWCGGYQPLRRTGAKAGDFVVSVGCGGVFWRDAFRVLAGGSVDKTTSPLYRPLAKSQVMPELARAGLIHAAMDNSDGLLPSIKELSEKNRLSIEIYTDELTVEGVSKDDQVGAAKMWMGWGDWNIIACLAELDFNRVQNIASDNGQRIIPIGRVLESEGPVYLRSGDYREEAPRLESERFSRDSWMLTGIQGYVDLLKQVRLPGQHR